MVGLTGYGALVTMLLDSVSHTKTPFQRSGESLSLMEKL
jgi:hypothetical protein